MSRKRIHRYTLISTANTRPMLANSSSSAGQKARRVPRFENRHRQATAIADTQNSSGRIACTSA
jgi:hypothetical protein